MEGFDFSGLMGAGGSGGSGTGKHFSSANSIIEGDTVSDSKPLYVVAGLAAVALLVVALLFRR